jgi:hypothetical protein
LYDILYPPLNGGNDPTWSDPAAADPEADEPWRFTDPVAQALYAREGRLDQLKDDLLAYVMCNGEWAPDELEYGQEIRRLLRANVLHLKGTFSYLSPHPTVYRATGEGVLAIAGQKHHFAAAEDITFAPWLARVSYPGLSGPVCIGHLHSVSRLCLSYEAFPRVGALCDRALAILRQTMPAH